MMHLTGKKILWFLLGAACFVVSQVLLRLPLLRHIQNSTDFIMVYTLNPLLIGILIALSACVFEEGFRFLFKQFLIKPGNCCFAQPVIFGLGHGIAEALYILLPALSLAHVSQLGLAFLERFLAIILHVTLTVVVWNGFQRKQRILYLLAAIAIHGVVDALIPIFSPLPNPIIWIYAAVAAIDVVMAGYSYYSRKYYVQKEEK
ncbi:MAG: YhfC family glutamic-type intramembrane protease [Bacillota bacterium]